MRYKKIHFVGIKGVGMTPLAVIAKEAGLRVSGCDINQGFITDAVLFNAKINPLIGFDKNHVKSADLVITTGAHGGFDNPENIEAKKLGIPVLTQGEAVAKFQKGEIIGGDFKGVSVGGTHGKTTTTAMIATILSKNNFDPSFLVGTGMIPYLNSNGHFGKGKYFIAEADEYAVEPKYDKTPKMLLQKPYIGVITNIEFDHPDVYPTFEHLENAFLKFTEGISKDGCLVLNLDSDATKNLRKIVNKRIITYGFSKLSDFTIERVNVEIDKTFFWVSNKGISLGEFSINVAGEHNALNALASIIVSLELGLSIENIKIGLTAFNGTKRRLEFVKLLSDGAIAYDDYAHHPTEIKKTLATLRKIYPNKKIVCIFQPHTYSRTKILFEQFVGSFTDVYEVILSKIYSSEREKPDPLVSSKILAEKISNHKNNVSYSETIDDVIKYLNEKHYDRNYVIVSMGAGDIYKIWNKIK